MCQRYMKWSAASRCVREVACCLKFDSLFCVYSSTDNESVEVHARFHGYSELYHVMA